MLPCCKEVHGHLFFPGTQPSRTREPAYMYAPQPQRTARHARTNNAAHPLFCKILRGNADIQIGVSGQVRMYISRHLRLEMDHYVPPVHELIGHADYASRFAMPRIKNGERSPKRSKRDLRVLGRLWDQTSGEQKRTQPRSFLASHLTSGARTGIGECSHYLATLKC